MNNFIFNSNPIKQTPIDIDFNWDMLWSQPMFKYSDLKWAKLLNTNIVNSIIESAPLTNKFKYQLLDVKMHDLNEGECPCIFGWHLDGHPNPKHYDTPAIYHLFLIGPEHSRTLFIKNPIELDVTINDPKEMDMDYKKQIKTINPEYIIAPEKTWVTFTSEDFHSGPIFSHPAQRLLIRIAETNWVKPNNKIVEKAYKEKRKD